MMSKSKATIQERRGFLRNLAVASGAATAAGITAKASAAVEGTDVQSDKPQTSGYKETAHVREYYRLARF